MAVRALLPAYDAQGTPLAELVPPLELALFSRQPLLAAAAGEAGATAASIVTSLIRHVQSLRAGASVAGPASGGGATGAASAPHDAIEEALTGSAFLTFKAAVSSADFLTAGGRQTAFEAATVGDCVLPIRVLALGEVGLSKRDPALGSLLTLRPFLPDWYTYCAAVEITADGTGVIPQALTSWGITGEGGTQTTFLDQFLRFEYDSMNWLGSHAQPGLLHYLSRLRRQRINAPHAADHYCVPATTRALGDFGQALFSGTGYPAAPAPPGGGGPAGYSFKTWMDFYADHCEKATTLPTRAAQLDWLDDAELQMLDALRLMSLSAKAEICAVEGIRDHVLNALLPYDCRPAAYMRAKVANLEEDIEREARMRPFGHAAAPPAAFAHAHQLPLRSERRAKLPSLKRARAGEDGEGGEDGGRPDLLAGGVDLPPKLTGSAPIPVWLKNNELLLVSGRVWRVKALAAQLGIAVKSKCWGVLLSGRKGSNKLVGCCTHCKGEDHATLTSSAHVLDGFDPADYRAGFSDRPKDGEWARALAAQPRLTAALEAAGQGWLLTGRNGGKGGGGGGGKGGRAGRASGRGGRQPHFRQPAGK